MRGRRLAVTTALAGLALSGACANGTGHQTPTDQQVEAGPSSPPARTSWQLRHRIVESADLQVVGQGIDQYGEGTSVSLGAVRGPSAKSCSVSVSVPGQGGPEHMVGEKVRTEFHGRPAVRNGAGAEGAYLMWQLTDGSWAMATCDDPDDHASVERVAAAVEMETSAIAIPFTVDLPAGYPVTSIGSDRDPVGARVYAGRVDARSGLPGSDIEISYEAYRRTDPPDGRPITIGNHRALLNENPTSPSICLVVIGDYVCVASVVSDTGPYPDRSGDIPTLTSIANSLVLAPEIDDRSTWFPADTAFR